MKSNWTWAGALVLSTLLAACGGGGGEPGGPESLSLSIDTRSITYQDDRCTGPSNYSTVYIFGGIPPFTVLDPFPGQNILQFDLTNLNSRSFQFRHLIGCVETAPIFVKDQAGKTAKIEFSATQQTQQTP